ncbi:MAG TPA: LPS assembly protein LptD, partial [Patescibacteria group bacterium]|nr:LPS assembly protein LptD [Patescibacteria group bacterium]
MTSRLPHLVLALACAALTASGWARAAGTTGPATKSPAKLAATEQPVISANKFEQVSEGELLLTGDVDLRYGDLRLLADTVHFNDKTHQVQAEGNVVLMLGKSQISGDRLEMDSETRLATVWNAHGYMDPDVIFQAEKLERIAEDKVVITNGTVTTCTQPTPYWAFHVTSALLHLDHYAHMKNVAFKVEKAPVIYLPYLVWPMKKDRASGLLLPNVGYSKQRGSFIGNALYLVLGRSQDATLYYDLYGRTGTGLGFEYRFVPAARGDGMFTGYYLKDSVQDPNNPEDTLSRTRYRFNFRQTQRFANGFRLLADLNQVSDLDYYLDFERDITQTTSPTVLSHVDLVRNWSNYSLNVRADRQEQFISSVESLTLERLPEVELRGRGIRFGHTPFYLSFESSAGLYNKDRRFETLQDPNQPVDPNNTEAAQLESTYQRFDLFPTISASFTPTPWLDISPSVSARETFYSRSQIDPADPNSLTSDENITREFAAFNLSMVGPRFFRLFGDPKSLDTTVYKHTFEPRLLYTYIPDVSDGENVIRFDDIDALRHADNEVTYSLTSRLLARRPVSHPPPPP